jgi:hypothetical protein
MGALHHAAPKLYLPAGDPVRPQKIKADGGPHNIDDRIQGPHLVKGYIIRRGPVYLGFRPGDPGKNIQCPLFRPFADIRPFNNSPDLLPGIMVMAAPFPAVFMVMVVIVVMFMRVFVAVFVFVVMAVVMIVSAAVIVMFMGIFVVPGDMIGPAAEFYHGVGSADAPPLIGEKFQFPARKVQFFQFPEQDAGVYPQIHQRAQGHVPGNSGITIKV